MQLQRRAFRGALGAALAAGAILASASAAHADTLTTEPPARPGGLPAERTLNPQPEPPGVLRAFEDAPGAVCQTCPPPPPPPPGGGPVQKLFEIEVTRVSVHDAEDNDGIDDVYIRMNGDMVWGPWGLKQGFSYPLWPGELVRGFYKQIKVSLYDDDWPDSDDFLGAWWIPVNDNTPAHGNQLHFTGSGTSYWLHYKIRPA